MWEYNQRITVENHDGRAEEFWLADYGSIWHRWQFDQRQTVCRYRFWGVCWRSENYTRRVWSAPAKFTGYLKNLTAVRRADGRLEIAGLGDDRALYIKRQTCKGCDWGDWERVWLHYDSYYWETLQADIYGSVVRYVVRDLGRSEMSAYPSLFYAKELINGKIPNFHGDTYIYTSDANWWDTLTLPEFPEGDNPIVTIRSDATYTSYIKNPHSWLNQTADMIKTGQEYQFQYHKNLGKWEIISAPTP